MNDQIPNKADMTRLVVATEKIADALVAILEHITSKAAAANKLVHEKRPYDSGELADGLDNISRELKQ